MTEAVIAQPPALQSLAPAAVAPPAGSDDLARLKDMTVRVTAVVGRTRMRIADLLKAGPGVVVELDRKVGEPVDILVNDRLVARGEIVMIEGRLGVTLTETVKSGD